MFKKLLLILGISTVGILGSFGITYALSTYASIQVGTSPANGKVLQTDGNNSTWVSTSSLGIQGAGTVTSITASSPLTGGTITTSGTIGLGTVGVANGGTGATTFGQGWIYSLGGTTALNSSTSPTVNYVTATSTTATSTFAAGLQATYLNLTGTTASSTFGNGINITHGCFAVNGTCITGGSGANQTPWTSDIDGAGFKLFNVGTTTVATINATSTIATSSIANFNTIEDASRYSGADIGAKINTAYAACPSVGCKITVPAGTFTFSTPIVFGTDGKMAMLSCPVGGGYFDNSGTVLQYTASTGKAITFNTNNFVTAGTGIENCSFVGPVGTGNVGAIATSTYGVELGGTHGAFGTQLNGVHISGFGTGLDVGANVSFLNVTNSVINENAVNINDNPSAGANGENMRVSYSVLADGNNNLFGNSTANYCVNIQNSGNVQWSFTATSFDDCQLYINQFGGTANVTHITNSHFENPGAAGGNGGSVLAYDYISALSNQPADEVVSMGNDYMQDSNGSGGKQDEFIAGGADFISIGDTLDLNNNVNASMTNFILNSNATNVDTISWTGLTNNGTAPSGLAAVKNIYPGVSFSPQGYGTGLGLSFQIGLANPTDVGTTTASDFEGVMYAPNFSGANIGAQVNTAYAACPKKGCIIQLPRGKFSYSTPILFGVNGKRALLQGAPAEGTELDYTGTGAAITLDDGIQATGIDHTTGQGITGVFFQGNNLSTTSPQIGVQVGVTNGSDGTVLDKVNIFGFGIGLQTGQNVYHFLSENSTIRNNGQNVNIPFVNNDGESMGFFNDFIVDQANLDPFNCFNVGNSGADSLTMTGGSVDDCQVVLGFGTHTTFSGVHMENPATSEPSYPFVVVANSAYSTFNMNGGTFVNDQTTNSPSTFIKSNDSTVNLSGVTVDKESGSTVSTLITNSGGSVTWSGFNNTAGGVTNIIGSVLIPVNGSTGSTTLTALGTAAGAFLAVDPNGLIITTTTPSGGGGSGTVTNIATNASLTGGPITTTGTLGINGASLSTNGLITWNGSQLVATGTPQLTVGNLVATSTATSTFAGGITNADGKVVSNQATWTVGTNFRTADYTNIQTALNIASTTGGGLVHVKSGAYTITSPLKWGQGTILEGEGWGPLSAGGTVISFNGASVATATQPACLNSSCINNNLNDGFTLRNMEFIDTSQSGNTSGSGTCNDSSFTNDVHIENIDCYGAKNGFFSNQTLYETFTNDEVNPFNAASGTGYGFYIAGSPAETVYGNSISFVGVNKVINQSGSAATRTTGFYIDGQYDTAQDIDAEGLNNIGIEIGPDSFGSDLGLWAEDNATGVQIDSGANGISLHGLSTGNTTADLTDNGGTNLQNKLIVDSGNISGGSFISKQYFTGSLGIGTSTPFGILGIQGTAGSLTNLLQIASSTKNTYLRVDSKGHLISGGVQPTVSSCGTTPNGQVTGTDDKGTITLGGSAPTACTLNFSVARTNNYECTVSDNSLTVASDVSATTTTSVTFGLGIGGLAGGNIYYQCGEYVNN